jgi:hypothetical protein
MSDLVYRKIIAPLFEEGWWVFWIGVPAVIYLFFGT